MERKRGRKLMGEINVVPYIDVMLVLLIIFMVTAPMLSQGIKVDLPKAGAAPIEPDKLEPLLLSVDRDGRFYLNIGALTRTPALTPTLSRRAGEGAEALTPTLSRRAGEGEEGLTEARVLEIASAALRREPERPVLVKADRAVAYGRVVEGMVLLQKAGARKVGFVTDPAPSLEARKGSR
jgi:biopolymer transport protein TolR